MSKGFEAIKGKLMTDSLAIGYLSETDTTPEQEAAISYLRLRLGESQERCSINVNWSDGPLTEEAALVQHETGLTPRQLAEQRAELLEALQLFVAHADEIDLGGGDAVATTCESLQSARTAIANATQQRNATGGKG